MVFSKRKIVFMFAKPISLACDLLEVARITMQRSLISVITLTGPYRTIFPSWDQGRKLVPNASGLSDVEAVDT